MFDTFARKSIMNEFQTFIKKCEDEIIDATLRIRK